MSIESLRRHRYLLLLLVLVALVVLQTTHTAYPYVREALSSFAMLLAFLVVFERPRFRLASMCAGLVAIAAIWLQHVVPAALGRTLEALIHAGTFLFLGAAVAVILIHLFERRAIRLDDILGTLCGYLLAAAAWANLLALIELLQPGSFEVTAGLKPLLADWSGRDALFSYYSLITLTTVGFGDVTPLAGPARGVSALEAVFGQFYIAVVVAQLVGSRLAEAAGQAGSSVSAREPPAR